MPGARGEAQNERAGGAGEALHACSWDIGTEQGHLVLCACPLNTTVKYVPIWQV